MLPLLAVITALAGEPASSESSRVIPGPMPTILGISLGTSLEYLERHLGKPRSTQVVTDDSDAEFGIEVRQLLSYKGLRIEVVNCDSLPTDSAPGSSLCVIGIHVIDKSRTLSNSLRVGMSVRQVLRIMGTPSSASFRDNSGVTTYDYNYNPDRTLVLSFRDNVLFDIEFWQGLRC